MFSSQLGSRDARFGTFQFGNVPLEAESAPATGDQSFSVSDFGFGSDSAAVSAVGTTGDQGSGQDSGVPGPTVLDAGSGQEGAATLALPVAEAGQGVETATLTADTSVSDSGSGQDAGRIFLQQGDTGSGADTATPLLPVSDTGSAQEIVVADLQFGVEDQGSGVDTITLSISGAQFWEVGEQGSGAETGSLLLPVSEGGSGTESPAPISLSVGEFGSGFDSGALTVDISGSQFWTVEDPGAGFDAATLLATGSASDASSSAQDTGALFLFPTEAGSAQESASVTVSAPALAATGCVHARISPETRLPRWMRPAYDRETLLSHFFCWSTNEEYRLEGHIERLLRGRWLPTAHVNETRLLWTARFTYPRGDGRELRVTVTAGTGTILVRQARSWHEFSTAIDPVWYFDTTTRQFLLGALYMRQTTLFAASGVYTIVGESEGLVPDTGVYWSTHSGMPRRWLDAENPELSGTVFSIPPVDVALFASYGSQSTLSALSSGTVVISWQGSETISLPLLEQEVPNLFDGYGSLLGVTRLDREDNLTYKRRMLTLIQAAPGCDIGGVIRGVAIRTGLAHTTQWNGVDNLTFTVSGITAVHLVGVTRFRRISETLSSQGDGTRFYSTYSNPRPGWTAFVNGIPEPGVSVSGNLYTFSHAVTGVAVVDYYTETYRLAYGGDGYISGITAGTGLPSGKYTAVASRSISAYVPDLVSVQEERLLTADKLPNREFLELASLLQKDNPTAFGRARWESHDYWFASGEEAPRNTRLPLPLDANRFQSPEAFSPLNIPSLVAWYRSASLSGLTSGTAVSGWTDESGNANHLFQASIPRRPTYLTGFAQNSAAVRFNGTTHYLTGAHSASLNLTGSVTLAAVVRPSSVTQSGHTIVAKSSEPVYALSISASGQKKVDAVFGSFASNGASGAVLTNGLGYILVATFRAGQSVKVHVNGSLSWTESTVPSSISTSTGSLSLGALLPEKNFFTGDMVEVAAFNAALDDDIRERLERVWADSYGIYLTD
jgi:hypothetical protein